VTTTEILGYLATNLWSRGHSKKVTKTTQERPLARRHSNDNLKSRNKHGDNDIRNSHKRQSQTIGRQYDQIANGVVGLIGNTPLLRLNALSAETGCEILASFIVLS
jgi:hypothetical protein